MGVDLKSAVFGGLGRGLANDAGARIWFGGGGEHESAGLVEIGAVSGFRRCVASG